MMDDGCGFVRGVLIALLLCIPFWLLVALWVVW
jgi:hypothetical protein